MRRRRLLLTITLLALTAGVSLLIWRNNLRSAPSGPASQTIMPPEPSVTNPGKPEARPPEFNKQLYSLDDPASIWAVVNKQRPLQPQQYAPADLTTTVAGGQLRPAAAEALNRLITDARAAGRPVKLISSYRSYQSQQQVYGRYVAESGQASADTFSARPGHSEHQTGLAADLGNAGGQCDLEACFGATPLGKWLAANAHSYGFTVRYPEGKTAVTGYTYEPWHLRYVGTDLAAQLQQKAQTLEEFFGLPAAPDYR